ncbi:4-oxalomesaconate tautomerase [Actinacidiphila yanglinensis]|uniref:4-oxalomesaconate tautomerase n=1 Tax=Actinacidiphila yanglinensis TaxID=310779 RepID=A0A1H6CJF4_9ACTN|nr:hypothetical protein [Actinacidiphila yanglinensis]SEG72536.1 4-oxalomesaconate tautomerase [Actinacidiphila yanglinensis]
MGIEHPSGRLLVRIGLDTDGTLPRVRRSSPVRTARKPVDGTVFPRPS